MSQQTSLDSYFKVKSNVKPAANMNTNKLKKRSLSLNRSPRPFKSPRKLNQLDGVVKADEEVICLSSSSEDLLTPPEQKHNVKAHNSNTTSPNTSADSSSTIVYSVSPKTLQHTPKTPLKKGQSPNSTKKFYSPTKKRIVTNRSPAKRSLAFEFKENNTQQDSMEDSFVKKHNPNYQDDKTLFFLTMIEKYLQTDSLKCLLDEESQELLSNCKHVSEPGMRLVSRLYWRQPGWFQMDQLEKIASDKKTKCDEPMSEIMQSLHNYHLVTSNQNDDASSMDFDDYVKLLKSPVLQQICKELKFKLHSKQDAVEALRKLSRSSAISNFFTGKTGNNRDRVLKILKLKAGTCYKLSDVARNTLYKLYLLMYLGIDYTLIREKKLEFILLHDKASKEMYPIDKNMILDNASVVFQNKEEFHRYLEAHLSYEEYITSTDTQEKCDIVFKIFNMYKEITKEHMLRYKSMPSWLRRFTPGNIYVKIMESGVQELKKVKCEEYYTRALDILERLISQTTYRQHHRADWYAEKALILHKHLDRSEQAAYTLVEGFNIGLSEEAKDRLRPRAKLIANQRNVTLAEELRQSLRDYGDQEHVLESNIPADHVYKQPMDNHNQRGKLKFEAYTDEGRTILSAEDYCILHYTQNGEYTHGGHWEGRLVTTIFTLLFWDIIYAKPPGVVGIFMSHYQRHPLDMYSEEFYTNRKTLIDDRLTFIEESTDDMVVEMLQSRWEERPESEVSDIARNIGCSDVSSVAACVGARGVGAMCRRLATNYGYTHSGFPDLTLWNVHTKQVKFVEVKTDADKPSMKQLQWLQYLRQHGIAAGFCYVGANTTRCRARHRDTDTANH